MLHDEQDEAPLGERCGGWWSGGRTATGSRVVHECSRPRKHDGACACDCGAHAPSDVSPGAYVPPYREHDALAREDAE